MQPRKVRLDRPANCRFDERYADRAVNFIETYLRHTKGRFAGRPFKLLPFQEHDIREIFGRVDEDGNRVIKQVYTEVPKKNGKSEIAAAVALKMLFADSESGAEVYGAAADRDQANIVFSVAAQMVRHEPKLSGICKIIDSTKRIVIPNEGSFYRALSSEVSGKHGFNTHGCIFDEVHAQRDMRLWEVLTFGAGAARTQPLTYAITTAGVPGESPVAEMLHEEADQILRGITPCPDHFYPVIYGAPDDAPWDSEEVWYDCNPLLKAGVMRIESVREEYDDARRRNSQQNSFRRLRLNQWVAQETRWIDMDAWDACNGAVDLAYVKDLPCYVGVDLSTKLDVTAVVLCWLAPGNTFLIQPYFWIPKDNLADRPNMETAKYREWIKHGYMTATDGNAIHFDAIRDRIVELSQQFNIRRIGYDKQFAEQLSQQLSGDGLTVLNFPQGHRGFTEPCIEMEAAIAERRIRHGGHPVLRWMIDNVTVKQTPKGEMMMVKPDRRKSGKRIDGAVAMGMAVGCAIRDDYTGPSIYETRGILTF